ncbi:MAG: PDZ domain-containing protein, partial [Gammaproteobacteria bacterium]
HIGMLRIGERVEFEIIRGGKRKTIDVEIEAPEMSQPMAVNQRLQGMSLGDLDENHSLFGEVEGVIIIEVERGSPAWASGLRRGDIITSVNHQPVRSVKEFLAEVDKQTDPLLIRMIRGNSAAFVVIK